MPLSLLKSLLEIIIIASIYPNAYCSPIDTCPGYAATNVVDRGSTLTADLSLNGPACNTYGRDLDQLSLLVEYLTGLSVHGICSPYKFDVSADTMVHIKIFDPAEQVYQVPANIVGRPISPPASTHSDSRIQFSYIENPFSFAITRTGTSEVLFNTTGSHLIFQSQYLRLRTTLPAKPNLYGLGEHADSFRLPVLNYTRTLWNRDAYQAGPGENLHGSHPIYFEHRSNGQTHGVYLLNSNGMDIKINQSVENGQFLEYNILGGIIDLYFVAGPTPIEVARQMNEAIGPPVRMPYWNLGFHQCRYGLRDVYEVAEVVANYSAANIPLETMWTDIDYMDGRKMFSLDPDRFPLKKVQELIRTLHDRGQHYAITVNPGIAYQDYPPFHRGVDQDVFLKTSNGSIYKGVTWSGATAFPDFFNQDSWAWFNNEFSEFSNADTGVDVDAVGIDMNEPSNYCPYPCSDAEGYANTHNYPPTPPSIRQSAPRPISGFPPDFQPLNMELRLPKRQSSNGKKNGLPNRDLIDPNYEIQNGRSFALLRLSNPELLAVSRLWSIQRL